MLNKLKHLLKIRGIKFVIEIILIIIVFLLVKFYTQQGLATGTPPPLAGALLNGTSINLDALKGKPVLLHFWASWCPVCQLEQDSIESIHHDYTVLSVAMKSGTDLEVQSYLNEHKLSFPTLTDEEGLIAKRFGVHGVPVSFIIDPDGQIKFIEKGYTTEYGLRFRLWLTKY